MNLINQIMFPIITLIILLSILGYGILINKYTCLNYHFKNFKNLIFLQGLFFTSCFSILINLFFPISNVISVLILLIGIILYLFEFIIIKNKKKELKLIITITVISSIFSYYSGVNDDFAYHFKTILNFKEQTLYQIYHERDVSYNSNWLFLNSVFFYTFIPTSIFVISSLAYSIFVIDSFRYFKHSINKKNDFYSGLVAFFILIFFLSILNKLKDAGTDIPGVILASYIIIVITKNIFDNKTEIERENFMIIFFLFIFAFVIKITNVLLVFFLIFVLLKTNLKKIQFFQLSLFLILPLLWIYQNVNISGCLIWPMEFTCLANNEEAKIEGYMIESFAKGDQNTKINVNGIEWVNTWLDNHLGKIIEVYLVYSIIFISPVLYFFIKYRTSGYKLINQYLKIILEKNYFFFLLIIFLSNLIWFFNAPAFRFGLSYNLSLVIFLILPFWIYLFTDNFSFIKKFSKYLLFLIILIFISENIIKINWYINRYDVWPPIINGELILRK